MTRVEVWVDPSCSFTWVTSRWLLHVQQVRPIRPEWHVMSLSVLHEGREDHTDRYRQFLARAWGPARVLVAAEAQHGQDVLLPLYTAIATRFYLLAEPRDQGTVAEALADVGLPRALSEVMTSSDYDHRLRESHDAAVRLLGDAAGTPTLAIDGTGFFGPVLTKAPQGEAAGRLWDAVVTMAACPDFHEVKRPRDKEPDFT